MPKQQPRILLYDLETTPILGYTWGFYEQNVLKIVESPYILCFAYKWLDEKKTHVVSLTDFPGYKKNKKNDRQLVKNLHELMDEADITIAQNGDRFDNKWANKQFIKHNLPPVSPYKSIDTLKIARKHFRFDSNRLDDLGEFLGVGRKVKHQGIDLWMQVMSNDPKAWEDMKRYVRQDVVLLEKLYLKLRPFTNNHPNLNQYTEDEYPRCPICQSYNIIKKAYRPVGRFSRVRRYLCKDCGGWSQGKTQRIPELEIS